MAVVWRWTRQKLRGHPFTVWTDNTSLAYIMIKPKLDACEQRWVSKLGPYTFDLKHIPGTKNTVADAPSRDHFTKTVSHRLTNEHYSHLLAEAEAVSQDGIQDVFRLKVHCHQVTRTACGVVKAGHDLFSVTVMLWLLKLC